MSRSRDCRRACSVRRWNVGWKLPLLLLFLPVTAAGFTIRGSVIASGGPSSSPASNGSFKLYGTLGQPAVGRSQVPNQVVCSGFWCFGGSRVVAVEPPGGTATTDFTLGPAAPTPTRGRVHFRLVLPQAAEVTLAVHDIAGRQIGEPASRPLAAGEHGLYWEDPAARTGIYFVRLTVDGVLKAKRTVVLVR